MRVFSRLTRIKDEAEEEEEKNGMVLYIIILSR